MMRDEKEVREELLRLEGRFESDRQYEGATVKNETAISFLKWVLRVPPYDFDDATPEQRAAHIEALRASAA